MVSSLMNPQLGQVSSDSSMMVLMAGSLMDGVDDGAALLYEQQTRPREASVFQLPQSVLRE
jgi:hypothetical protein